MAHDTIPARLLAQAKTRPDAHAYCVWEGDGWKPTSWKDYVAQVRQVARALLALGLGPGGAVAILGTNRPEWVLADVAAMCVGAVPAGIYTTCSAEEVRYIVQHAGCAVVVVENAAQWEKVKSQREHLPELKKVVLMKGAAAPDDPLALSWEAFLALAEPVEDKLVDERIAALEPQGLATLIYTSGTTGPPKGVMLSHKNLTWTADNAREITGLGHEDVSLSYLPLSHIAEQMFTIHGPISGGVCVHFCRGLEKFPEDLKSVQPTVFFGVPRIWEKFHAGVSAKLAAATGIKKFMADWAQGVGRRVHALKARGEPLPGFLAWQYGLASKLVFSKVKTALGLGRARMCVSGAAPVAREVLEFFTGLDVAVHEVYGQSEDTGPTSFNRPGKTKFGTVGQPIPGIEVKLGPDDEILVRGPNVFLGYYKDPEATAATVKDGWLHSGDLGSFDQENYLSITGRKKDILITSGGKNITPKNIEGAVKNHPLVSEAVLIGDRRHYLTMLVTLDPEAAERFLKEKGEAGPAHESKAVRATLDQALEEVNRTLARVETVKKFTVLPRPFSIEHGELTPTLKVKRAVVYKNWSAEIEKMYTA